MDQFIRFINFRLERWIQRGILHQILLVASAIALIAVAFGVAGWASTEAFESPFEAIWWAFLRLTDPGYLGDDEGSILRTLSTIVTVLGYVLFMGSLVAIMTQWLAQKIERLDEGLTPISMRGHVVVLGWTNRTPEIVREIASARGRLSRFLERASQRRLRIVVVTEEAVSERRQLLKAYLGPLHRQGQVYMRLGSESSLVDLARFDLARAGAIIIPGDEFRHADAETSDAHVVRSLLGLRAILESKGDSDRPQVVAEITDPRKAMAAKRALGQSIEVIRGNTIIAQLLAQAIRDPRLVDVILALLSHARGPSPYVKGFAAATGRHPASLDAHFDRAVVLGAVRDREGQARTFLNPPPDFEIETSDRLVLLARSSRDLVLEANLEARSTPSLQVGQAHAREDRRVLVLGWSAKIGSILEELGRNETIHATITLVSRLPETLRSRSVEGFSWDAERIRLEHVERDFTMAGVLEDLDPVAYDRILIMASTEMTTPDQADARTIIGYELVTSVIAESLGEGESGPEVILELVDPNSERLLTEADHLPLLVPRILGHLAAHVALLGELGSVFEALLLSGRIAIRKPEDFGLEGPVAHGAAMRAVADQGEVLIALIHEAPDSRVRLELCPSREHVWDAAEAPRMVVISRAP